MRRFFIAMVTVVLMTSAVFLSGCSLGTPDRETELKDTRLEVEDEWLTEQGLDEGSTWNITDEKNI